MHILGRATYSSRGNAHGRTVYQGNQGGTYYHSRPGSNKQYFKLPKEQRRRNHRELLQPQTA